MHSKDGSSEEGVFVDDFEDVADLEQSEQVDNNNNLVAAGRY